MYTNFGFLNGPEAEAAQRRAAIVQQPARRMPAPVNPVNPGVNLTNNSVAPMGPVPSSIGGLMSNVIKPDIAQMQPGMGLMDFNRLAYNMSKPSAQMPYSGHIMKIFKRDLPPIPAAGMASGKRDSWLTANDPFGIAPGYKGKPNTFEKIIDPAGWHNMF